MKKLFFILSLIFCISITANAQYSQTKKYIKEDLLTETVARYDYYTTCTYINTAEYSIRLDAPNYTTFGGSNQVIAGIYNTKNQLIRKYKFSTTESQDGTSLWLRHDYEQDTNALEDTSKDELIDFILNDYGYVRFSTYTYGGYEYNVKVWTVKKNVKQTVTDFTAIDKQKEIRKREQFVTDSIQKRNKFVADSLRMDSIHHELFLKDSIRYYNSTKVYPGFALKKKPKFINDSGLTLEEFIKSTNNVYLNNNTVYCIVYKDGTLKVDQTRGIILTSAYTSRGIKNKKKIKEDILEGIQLLEQTKWIPGENKFTEGYGSIFKVNASIDIHKGKSTDIEK